MKHSTKQIIGGLLLTCAPKAIFFIAMIAAAVFADFKNDASAQQKAPVTLPDTLRILAIGNSFSANAVEQNLYELAKAEGVELIIGNMYIGGCTMQAHLNNARSNAPAYQYRKIVNGEKTNRSNAKLSEALTDELWDFVSMQQASPNSGQYDTYAASLPPLVEYVKSTLQNDGCKLVLHQTWAYAQNSDHAGFSNYGRDQMAMYGAIVDANKRAAELVHIDITIPSGTAVQNGRTTVVGDHFTQDGYHLNDMGRYTVACTWMEILLGKNAVGNSWYPSDLSPTQAKVAQQSAHCAVVNPHIVTNII